ncbi:MAG TPA: hypothetical protein VN696_18860 [Pyrinomonadaceae bacterium]|nr:hypothetical protein [Pyrinomonadaceae bacterium]
MTKNKAYVTLLITGLILTAIFSRVRDSRAISQSLQLNQLTIRNMTSGFSVVSAISEGEKVSMSFRNDYAKPINGFTLSGGVNSGAQVDLINGEHEILPNSLYTYRFAASNLEPSGSSTESLRITVLNVVFSDGTGDGDPQATADINNRRLGEQIALEHIVPIFDEVLKGPDLNTIQNTALLRERIETICGSLIKQNPIEVQGGILHGKQYLLGDIEQAEKEMAPGSAISKAELQRIKEHYEKKSQNLKKALLLHNTSR